MNPKNAHNRILLNKNPSGQVAFCEGCDAVDLEVELEVGAVSLRLHAQDLSLFSALVQEAETRLRYYRVEKAHFDTEMVKMGGMH